MTKPQHAGSGKTSGLSVGDRSDAASAAGLADNELGGERDARGLALGVGDASAEHFDGACAHVGHGDADGGEGGTGHARDACIVEADNREVGGDMQAGGDGGGDDSGGHFVVGGEDAVSAAGPGADVIGGEREGRFVLIIEMEDIAAEQLASRGAQFGPADGETGLRIDVVFVTTDEDDARHGATIEEVAHHGASAVRLVDDDAVVGDAVDVVVEDDERGGEQRKCAGFADAELGEHDGDAIDERALLNGSEE